MQSKLYISLKERGAPQVVSREDWVKSGCSSEATELARLGVIKLTQAGTYLLVEPKTLVGKFDSPHLRLDVAPKTPALSAGLLSRLDGWRKKVDVADPSRKGVSSRIESVWKSLEILLSDLYREGLPWSYTRRIETSSTPRGKVLFRETLTQLISRGINHKVVSSVQVRSYSDSLAPALDAVRRRIAVLEDGSPVVRSRVARLIDLAGDLSVPIPEILAKTAFTEFMALEGRPALCALSEFCLHILEGDDSCRTSRRIGSGIAEFMDLEKLWESAVQMLLELHSTDAVDRVLLHPLRSRALLLFDDGGPAIDPDIISYHGADQQAVVDAKYSIASSPSADDVYQLSSYMSRLNCRVGILAYVSEDSETKVQKIGTLRDGRKLFACYLTLDAFSPEQRVLRNILSPTIPVGEMV